MKEIVQVPVDTPDSMLYSSKKVKGLGVYKAQWEAFLQDLNACHVVKKSGIVYMNSIFKIQEEQQKYINELGLENSDSLFNKNPSYTRGTHIQTQTQKVQAHILTQIYTRDKDTHTETQTYTKTQTQSHIHRNTDTHKQIHTQLYIKYVNRMAHSQPFLCQ